MNKTNRNILIGVLIVIAAVLIVYFAVEANKAAAPTTMQQGSASSTATMPSSTATTSSSGETVTGTPTTTASSMRTFSDASFSFAYPASWTIFTRWPISINNFDNNYQDSDIIPPGGIELNAVTTTAYGGVENIMQTELMHAQALVTSPVIVDNTECAMAIYKDNYSGNLVLSDVAIYCTRGIELWKIYFSFNVNDPAGAQHDTDFRNVLTSMKLIGL